MYSIYGLHFSPNTAKVIYVAETLNIDYDYHEINLQKKEQKTAAHLARHPLGKVPTLTHDDNHVFESAAICRYLAVTERSSLYPSNPLTRAHIDQWIDLFSHHPGRWLEKLLFERVIKAKFEIGSADEVIVSEAMGFLETQMMAVDDHLNGKSYFLGVDLSLADFFALAYVETTRLSGFSLSPYPNLDQWYQHIQTHDAVTRARETTLRKAP